MRVLVTGASGFVGSQLVPRLCAEGHAVRALGRDPARVRAALQHAPDATGLTPSSGSVEIVQADVLAAVGLAHALEGVELAFYFIHSMERIRDGRLDAFAERERQAAEHFAAAATRAGVGRIVYLGGLLPRDDEQAPVSRHLASRARVERLLLDAVPDSLALRASIVIGARSRSFRLLVHLLERMPVLPLPAWYSSRTQPIDARDVIEMLIACITAQPGRRSLDIGGPDVLSYGEMLNTIAELMLVDRPRLQLRVNLTGLAPRVAAAIAGEDPNLVIPLMDGLKCDLLPAKHHAAERLGVRLHSFDAAVEHALAEWEQREPLAAR